MKSKGYQEYLRHKRIQKLSILFSQIFIFVFLIFFWELFVSLGIMNSFITSSPKMVIETMVDLYFHQHLFHHIWITIYETLLSFGIGTILGIFIAILLWYNAFLAKVIDPYLTIFNSLPKVSLGPILIIWVGANIQSIILMDLLIYLIISIITVYNGFVNTDRNKIMLLMSFQASKWQILRYLIIPSNYSTIISSLKINVSMSLIGVIMGELLVSKEGIGYLIMYGSQVFNLNLVITGIIILMILSYLMYLMISYLEKILVRDKN